MPISNVGQGLGDHVHRVPIGDEVELRPLGVRPDLLVAVANEHGVISKLAELLQEGRRVGGTDTDGQSAGSTLSPAQ